MIWTPGSSQKKVFLILKNTFLSLLVSYKMSEILKISNLTKLYNNKFQALDNLSLNIKKGEIFALLGPNGAGKSTLINTICGILNFESGDHLFLVASSGCDYFSELSYPDKLEVGLAISRLGSTSVTYDLGLFKKGADYTAATGFFVHVHVTRDGHRPAPIIARDRAAFAPFVIAN